MKSIRRDVWASMHIGYIRISCCWLTTKRIILISDKKCTLHQLSKSNSLALTGFPGETKRDHFNAKSKLRIDAYLKIYA